MDNGWYPRDLAAFDPVKVWKMPDNIASMESIDGRLFVTLFDGRTVDMTNAFADTPEGKPS